MARRRRLNGEPEPAVIWQQAKTIDVEMGGLDIFDPDARPADFSLQIGSRKFLDAMNAGEFFTIGLPGDGMIKVRLRTIVAGPVEPLTKEFHRIRGATPPARLVSNSGQLLLHGGGRVRIATKAPTKDMEARAFHLGAGLSQEILVLVGPRGEPSAATADRCVRPRSLLNPADPAGVIA